MRPLETITYTIVAVFLVLYMVGFWYLITHDPCEVQQSYLAVIQAKYCQ